MTLNLHSLPTWERHIVGIFLILVVIGLAWAIWKFLRAISPEKQKRSIDRASLRFQSRLFRGHYPLGRYRSSGVSLFIAANLILLWIIALLIVLALLHAMY